MTRTLLSLYEVDRQALSGLESELRALLTIDDRTGVAKLLGLADALTARFAARPAVEWMVRADDDAEAAPFFASLRRIAKRRALKRLWTSEHPSLEGRLRAYDSVRDDPRVAAAVDRALDPLRVPFFLMKKGATMGMLLSEERVPIAEGLGSGGSLRDADLPPELAAFGEQVEAHDGDLILHDALD